MLIVQSQSTDVYRNLAVEEWLLENTPQLPVLLLYVNAPCVVIGKNQNPWRECRLSLMESEGVPLARRISGGGAVYHDEGNLNVSVIVPRTQYVEEKQYELIFQCLEKFGIKASKVRKNSLGVDGLKFSGQAFCFRKNRVMHHGTLLVNSDLDRLGRYLGPEVEGIETKAVASVPAEVANLSSFALGLTVKDLSDALVETFEKMYTPGEVTRPTVRVQNVVGRVTSPGVTWWSDADVQKAAGTQFLPMVGKISSNDWKLCHTPRFQVMLNDLVFKVERGRVVNYAETPFFEDWLKQSGGAE